jgi:acetolactate synthase-1/2/3 large subunit
MPPSPPNGAALDAWWKQINEWRKRDCLKFATSDEFIKPQSWCRSCGK